MTLHTHSPYRSPFRPSSQSRRASALESVLNVLIGYWVAILTQVVVFPLFGIHVGAREHAAIGLAFTVVSLVRSYALRRGFNALHVRGWLL